ncbi:MafB family polymorphic toxin, partial [Neisseria meningitidis]
NLGSNFSDRADEANRKMFEHNAKLDRWGNSMEFINGVAAGALNPFISAGEAVDQWMQENPNAAETVEALVNVLPFAKVKNLTKAAKPGKAAVSGDFSDSYKHNTASRLSQSVDGEMFQTRNVDFKAKSIGTKIHDGAQGKHISGHRNYIEGKSTLNQNINPQELLNGIHSGAYPVISKGARGNPVVDFGYPIGSDGKSGLSTNFGTIHSGKNGVHIVPANPKTIKKKGAIVMNILPSWLRVGMNIAMLGMIHSDIRLITVDYEEGRRFLKIKNYLSREAITEDHEDMEYLITELWSMCGEYFDEADFECIYSNHSSMELNQINGAVFRRKELISQA